MFFACRAASRAQPLPHLGQRICLLQPSLQSPKKKAAAMVGSTALFQGHLSCSTAKTNSIMLRPECHLVVIKCSAAILHPSSTALRWGMGVLVCTTDLIDVCVYLGSQDDDHDIASELSCLMQHCITQVGCICKQAIKNSALHLPSVSNCICHQ